MFRLITVLIIYSFISPEIFFFEGKSFNKYYVYFSRNFRPRQNKKTSVSITKPPCCDTGIFNHQHITNYKIKYNSRPLTVTNFRDSYGNKIEKTFFKPQTYRGKNSTISYEISFDAVLDNQVYQVNSDSVFPISNQETALTPFLKEVSGAFFSNTAVQRKAIELTLNSNLAADAVVILTLWVNRKIKEISFNNNTKLPYPVYAYQQRTKGYYKAGEVLQKKQGTFAGKINLLAAMIRSLGIPVRYVRGFSLEEHFDLTPASATNCPVIKKFVPKHENIWLEIWLDDLKWLPVSMRESALVMFPAYIKTRIGNSIKDLINNDYKNLKPVAGDLYFEKKETALTTNNFKICFSLSNYATPYFLPLLNTNSLKKILKHYTDLFKAAAAEFSKKTNSVVKCNSGLHQINEIKIKHGPAQNRYAQQINLRKTCVIEEVQLLLYQLLDSGGSIRVKIYDKKNRTFAYTSEKRSISSLRSLARNKWFGFSFNPAARLEPGQYLFIPETSGSSILHWILISENFFQNSCDSFIINQDKKAETVLSGDLGLRLILKSL